VLAVQEWEARPVAAVQSWEARPAAAVQEGEARPAAAVQEGERDTMHPHPLTAILRVDATPIHPANGKAQARSA